MPPEAIVAMVALVLGSVVLVTGMILGTIKARYKTKESSLRTSDLEEIMRRVVREANAPLIERVEAIEARLDAPRLLTEGTPLLESLDIEGEEELVPSRKKQRTH